MADLVNTTCGITRLNYHNYQSWRSRIKSYLEGQDLWEVVNGNDTKQPENAETLRIWKVKAAKAMYVLKSTIEDELLKQIRDDDAPNMAWNTLAPLFSKTNDLQYGVGERARMLRPEHYKAAKKGDVTCLERIDRRNITEEEAMNIQHGIFVNRTQHGNNNILHIAASAGRDNFVAEVLCRCPFLSDQVNSQGDTPLLVAARCGHFKVVKKLSELQDHTATAMQNGTNSSSSPRQLEQGTTALHEALRNGHEEVAQYLLKLDTQMANTLNGAGESALYLAVESGCELFMSDILKLWPRSAQGPNGRNVLHAAGDRYDTIVAEVIAKEPDLMRQLDKHGKAAIHYAVGADYCVLLDRMLKANGGIALLPDAHGYTPFLIACSRGSWKTCQKLLKVCPESIEARNHKGQNALHLFKFRKYLDWLKLFLIPEIQELVNVGDDEGNTPLHLAVKENAHVKALFLLASLKIDLWAVNKDGLAAFDSWEKDWMNSNRQVLERMLIPLIRYKAQHGRRPYDDKVPVEGVVATAKWEPVIYTMSLVATLIATVSFAAAFTMPGGFDNNPDNLGVAILVKKAALQAFILSDTIAMCSSILVVFLLMWALIIGTDVVWTLASISLALLGIALSATLVAFMSGIFAVIAPKALWLAILVCIMCSMAPFALSLTETLNSFTFFILPSAILAQVYVESIKRKVIKTPREQDNVHESLQQRRSPDTSTSMSNTNPEV